MPDGYLMGWRFSAMTDGWQPVGNKGDVDDGLVHDYSEDGSLSAAEPRSHEENPENVGPRCDSQAQSASVLPTV